MSTPNERGSAHLLNNNWVRLDDNTWSRKYEFIDMTDGSTSLPLSDALKVHGFLDDWPEPEIKMKKAKYSEKDSKGKLFVDCSECERGGNGSDEHKCSSGWKTKKGSHGGCFMGDLLSGLEV